MKYYVDDIRTLTGEAKEIEADSPPQAARKAFPNAKIKRDLTCRGDIVVGRYTRQWYDRGYRTYVYAFESEGSSNG